MAKILVVDDNRDIADAVALLLEHDGHDVRTVYDGAAALLEAARTAPDVVLLDIGLPRLDGVEVARGLRQMHGKAVLLIACTGYADDATRRRLSLAGFDRSLTKPVSLSELQAALRTIGPGA